MDIVKIVDAGKQPRVIAPRLAGYGLAVGGIALATGLLWVTEAHLNLDIVYLIYLVVVVGVAARWGLGPGILASVLGFLAANFFFIPLTFTFTIANPRDILALIIFLALATGSSQLMAQLRREVEAAQRQARMLTTLYELSQTINQQQDLGRICEAATAQLSRVLGGRSCQVILYGEGGHEVPIGGGSAPRQRLPVTTLPLAAAGQPLGRLLVEPALAAPAHDPEEERLLTAFAEQLATAIQRAHLQEAATQAEVLRRTDALRATLLSAVSHDLRSPLGAIQAAATSLLSTRVAWDEADRRAFLTTIVEQVEHINRLIGNLLAMGRIEAGKLRPQKEWAAIGPVITRVVERLDPQLVAHPVTVQIPENLPAVPFDPVEIDEVLTNLLENAVKYTPAGTPIRIRAERRGDAIAVAVADTGPGIAPEHLPYLFDRYYRVRAGTRGGTGLGLTIARGIVEAHGGQIEVISSPGHGATFTFTLPLPAPAAPAGDPPSGPALPREDMHP